MELPALDPALKDSVAPSGWINPSPPEIYDLIILGGGPAGLVAAAGAASLGLRTALVEKHALGGDCLVSGCVPSKFLIHAASFSNQFEKARKLGWHFQDQPTFNFAEMMKQLGSVRADLGKQDAAERFRKMGVDVFFGSGRFLNHESISVGDLSLRFRRAFIGTGARPSIPAIPGLDQVTFHTSDSFFNLREKPARLLIIGGGPIGCELGQAMSRLGTQVIILEKADRLLPGMHPLAGEWLQESWKSETLSAVCGVHISSIHQAGKMISVKTNRGDWNVDGLLVCTGRKPALESLHLSAAGVESTALGVKVDAGLQTTNPRIYAMGDACLGTQFTHAADASARVALQNAFFPLKKKWHSEKVPRAVFTDPEICEVGHDTSDYVDWHQTDRHRLSQETVSFFRIFLEPGTRRVKGALLAGPQASELSSQVGMVIGKPNGLALLANPIRPYPTRSEAFQKINDSVNRRNLTAWKRQALSAWFSLWRKW